MASLLTYTGLTGPAKTLTAAKFTNLRNLLFDPEHGTIKVTHGSGKVTDLDLQARSTITITISSGVITATVS
jgi:hypothetical protein